MKKLGILVIDDHPEVRQVIAEALQFFGHNVIAQAHNGQEGINCFEALKDQVDIVVTDLQMPGGKSGYDVALHIKSVSPQTQVVLMSASQEIDERDMHNAMVDAFVPKPFELPTLGKILSLIADRVMRIKYQLSEHDMDIV